MIGIKGAEPTPPPHAAFPPTNVMNHHDPLGIPLNPLDVVCARFRKKWWPSQYVKDTKQERRIYHPPKTFA